MTNRLERLALQRQLRVGTKRRVILKILDQARDPLTAQEVYQLALTVNMPISLPTIQRTLRHLVKAALLRRLKPAGRKMRYEKSDREWRESLIDTETGQRLDFRSEGIEELLKQAMQQLGYRLLDYRLELFGLPDSEASGPKGPNPSADRRASPRTRH